MTQLCAAQYRQQLTAWLQGQAELMVFNASDRYARKWKDRAQLAGRTAPSGRATALSQAVMLLIGGIAVVAMLWLASAGIGGNSQPGALIALFVFLRPGGLRSPGASHWRFPAFRSGDRLRTADLADHRPAAGGHFRRG